MDAKTYLKISAINLVFLLVGILLGIAFTTGLVGVHAQSKDTPTTKMEKGTSQPPALDPNAEYVTPGVTLGGPVLTNTLLANTLACDRLQVNSFDLLKVNDAILKLLAKMGASPADIQQVVQSGRADRPLRIKP
jgi:hypothetical protein